MKHDVIETSRPQPAAARPRRMTLASMLQPGQSADEVVEALIRFAGQMEVAETRAW